MRPTLNIPDGHPGQPLSDDEMCIVFVLVALSTMLSIGALVFLVSDAGLELTERLPCLPRHRSPPARRPARAGTPRFIWESFGLNGIKEP